VKILVTGSSGFFGSWLVPWLQGAGNEIVGYDLAEERNLFDAATLGAALDGCDAVIHLAAYPHYKPDILPQLFTRLNIIGTARLVEAMDKAKVRRLVYTASGAIYGFGPDRPDKGWVTPPIRETQKPTSWGLVDAYGASKLACEAWLACLPSRSWTVTSLRINCIEPLHWGAKENGTHWGWWVSQNLACRGFLAAAKRERGGYQIVNVAEPNSNMDLAQLDALLAGRL